MESKEKEVEKDADEDEEDKQEKKEAAGEVEEEKEGTWAPFTPTGCYLLHFTPSLTLFWPSAGSDFLPNWPPAAVLSWPLPLFFPSLLPDFLPAHRPSATSIPSSRSSQGARLSGCWQAASATG